ncbi:sensor histidine kinase [Kitasatospora sp. NPDC054939]
MPGISAPRPGHRAARCGSVRGSLLLLALVPSLALAGAWSCAAVLLHGSGHRTAAAAGSAAVAVVLLWSLLRGVRLSRTLTARLTGLRIDALGTARHEIPEIVGRLHAGENIPRPPAWVPARRGDEIQLAADGLDAVRQAALAAIIQQAQGREGARKVFLNVACRTQILIHRQISMLDSLEREHDDPKLLRELFAVDRLATRMRRNAENLAILGGALPARRCRSAVPMVNVLRTAVSETEAYARVAVQGVPRASLAGPAVADVIHLLAELIENGTSFSPPYTQVQVSAQEDPQGLAVQVDDRGFGIGKDEYERLNAYLADPPEPDVPAAGDDLRIGLYVVARLAARHGIRVSLRSSPYGGTRAVVLVPAALLEAAPQPGAVPGLPFGARITRMPAAEAAEAPGAPGAGATAGASAGADGSEDGAAGAGARAAGGADGTVTGAADRAGGGAGGWLGAARSGGRDGSGDGGGARGGSASRDGLGPNGAVPAAGQTGEWQPVGTEHPGLSGAVVVPRPVVPLRYDPPEAECLGG